MSNAQDGQRIDKWLWHTRFVKSRSLAQKMVTSGKVRIGGEKITSSSRKIRVEEILTLTLPRAVRIIEVTGIPNRRGPYKEACEFYKDLTPEPEAPVDQKPATPETEKSRRPTKSERRKIIALKQNFTTNSD